MSDVNSTGRTWWITAGVVAAATMVAAYALRGSLWHWLLALHGHGGGRH